MNKCSLSSKGLNTLSKPKKLVISKSKSISKPKIVAKTRDYSYGDNWLKFSGTVKKEQGSKCSECPSYDRVELHHIIPLSQGGKNNRLNMKPLCHKCHNKKHRHMKNRH